MGVREIDRVSGTNGRWESRTCGVRMILAPTPRERERWYAILLLVQGLTAAATAEALERDPGTLSDVGRRPSAREGLRP